MENERHRCDCKICSTKARAVNKKSLRWKQIKNHSLSFPKKEIKN